MATVFWDDLDQLVAALEAALVIDQPAQLARLDDIKAKIVEQKQIQQQQQEQRSRHATVNPSAPSAPPSSQRIRLNIGGTEFETTISTLTKDKDSMLAAMFTGNFLLLPDETGAYFIDRDPTYFGYILNYLRDGEAALPESSEEIQAILHEADFYQISGLIALLLGRTTRDKALGASNLAMRTRENYIRDLFATDPNNEIIQDPLCHLVNVFDELSSFRYTPDPPNLPNLTLIMTEARPNPMPTNGLAVCASLDEFKEHLSLFTAKLLDGLDWSNIFLAGGSVIGPLLPIPEGVSPRQWYFGPDAPYSVVDEEGLPVPTPANVLTSGFQSSDLDLFLYAVNEEQAVRKIEYLHSFFCAKTGKPLLILRTSRTITFVAGWPHRHVQIVLRLYRSPAEVLLGFDLDCVAIGYDGQNVYCLPRARRALVHRYNIADPTRQTFRTNSYEYRLYKYSQRGFAVAIPGLDRRNIDPSLFLKRFSDVRGLAKLLFLEARQALLTTTALRFKKKWLEKHGFRVRASDVNELKLSEQDIENLLDDYNDGVLLPFGPTDSGTYAIQRRLRQLVIKARSQQRPLKFLWASAFTAIFDLDSFSREHRCIVDLPRELQFVGSLAEYIVTLPDIQEEDFFKDALRRFVHHVET